MSTTPFDYARARARAALPPDARVRDFYPNTLRRYLAKKCPDCGARRTFLGQAVKIEYEVRPERPLWTALCVVDADYSPTNNPPKLLRFADNDTSVDVLAVCPCGRPYRAQPVAGKFNPSKECNAKCLSATRATCECRCSGLNHGAG